MLPLAASFTPSFFFCGIHLSVCYEDDDSNKNIKSTVHHQQFPPNWHISMAVIYLSVSPLLSLQVPPFEGDSFVLGAELPLLSSLLLLEVQQRHELSSHSDLSCCRPPCSATLCVHIARQ